MRRRVERFRIRRNRALLAGGILYVLRTIAAAFGLLVLWIVATIVAIALFVALLAVAIWWISPK